MDNSSKDNSKKSRRNDPLARSHKALNHSNSQPIFENRSQKDLSHMISKKLNNSKNNNNLILPRVSKNENYKYNGKNQTLNSSLNSSKFNIMNNYLKERDNSLKLFRQSDPKNVYNARKRLSRLLDDKIDLALGNKKLREELEKRRVLSKMKRRIDEEISRDRNFDNIKLQKEFNKIDDNMENIRLMRKKFLNEIKSKEIDDIENLSQISLPKVPPPFYPPLIPPQLFFPFNNFNNGNNGNNNSDSTGDLMKFLLVKKLLDQDKPLLPFPFNLYPNMPIPPWLYTFNPLFNLRRKIPRMYKMLYPDRDIVIINKRKRRSKNRRTKSSESPKGIPFKDPLEKYLDMLHKLRKRNGEDTSSSRQSESNKSSAQSIKLGKKKKKKGSEDEDDEDDDEEKEESSNKEEGEDGEDGKGEGEGEGEDGEGDGVGEGGEDGGTGGGEGGETAGGEGDGEGEIGEEGGGETAEG